MGNRLYAALSLVALLGLVGCEAGESSLEGILQSKPKFPPDRTIWEAAPPQVRVAHARALHTALMTARRDPVPWRGGETSGSVTVANIREVGPTICRGFTDRIETSGKAEEIRDIACWGDGWFLLRIPEGVPVLGQAFEEEGKVYTVKSGGSLAAVARRTGATVAELQALNPGHPRRLSRGTRILLP